MPLPFFDQVAPYNSNGHLPFDIYDCGTGVHHMMHHNADVKVDDEVQSAFLVP